MLSHNFVEARTFEHSKGLDGGEVEYLAAVLQTTSNVGGKVSKFTLDACTNFILHLSNSLNFTYVLQSIVHGATQCMVHLQADARDMYSVATSPCCCTTSYAVLRCLQHLTAASDMLDYSHQEIF
jgi:hypothetical protein